MNNRPFHRRTVVVGVLGLLGPLGLLAHPGPAAAGPRIELRTGRVLGLWSFGLALTGHWRGSRILQQSFDRSQFNTDEARALLRELRELRETHLTLDYRFRGYPEGRAEMGWDVLRFFELQSAKAPDLDDLEGRTALTLPAAEHRRFFELLRRLEPIYDAVVWQPARAKLERQRARLAAVIRRAHLEQMFRRAARFYDTTWPDRLPFVIVLHPIPGKSGNTTATVSADTAALQVLVDGKDLQSRFGILFHELCHALFEAQPAAVQAKLDAQFRASRSPYARYAYGLLNEALATALGNGWAFRAAAGKLDPGEWYNDPEIDRFARALYPRVSAYLESGRGIDGELVEHAVARYQEIFPDALLSFANLFKELILASDGKVVTARDAGHALRRQFRVPSLYRVTPIASESARQALAAHPAVAALLVVSPAERAQLRAVAPALPSLRPWLDTLVQRQGEWIFARAAPGQRPVVVVCISRPDRLQRALAELQRVGVIRNDAPVRALDAKPDAPPKRGL